MKNRTFFIAIVFCCLALSSAAQQIGTFTDTRDGKIYKTVAIGTRTWMAENLAYKANSGCWAFNDTLDYVSLYGYLYNWESAKTGCPSGWHLPIDTEWTALTDHLGGKEIAGRKLRSAAGWYNWNKAGKKKAGDIGFTALPGGERDGDGNFEGAGYRTFWWSATVYDPGVYWYVSLEHSDDAVVQNASPQAFGYSVRCVMD